MNLYELKVSCIEKGPGRVRVQAKTEKDAKRKFWARLKKVRPGGWLHVSINQINILDK